MSESGEKIVAQARTWLGTKFVHQGRVKNVGCDCIGLIVGIVGELGLRCEKGNLLADYDEKGYGKIPDGEMLQDSLSNCLGLIDEDKLAVGDLLLMRFEKQPQHVAIISDYAGGELGIIHCYQSVGKVVEHRLSDLWKNRIVGVYRVWSGRGC